MLDPVQEPFRQIANPGDFQYVLDNRLTAVQTSIPEHLLTEAEQKSRALVEGIAKLTGYGRNQIQVMQEIRDRLATVLRLSSMEQHSPVPGGKKYQAALDYLRSGL